LEEILNIRFISTVLIIFITTFTSNTAYPFEKKWEYQDPGIWGMFNYLPAKFRNIIVTQLSNMYVKVRIKAGSEITLSLIDGKETTAPSDHIYNLPVRSYGNDSDVSVEYVFTKGTTITSKSTDPPWTLVYKEELVQIKAESSAYLLALGKLGSEILCINKQTGIEVWRKPISFDGSFGSHGNVIFYKNMVMAHGLNINGPRYEPARLAPYTLVFYDLSNGNFIKKVSLPEPGERYFPAQIYPVSNGFLITVKDGRLQFLEEK
jgi:hypothetical protein